MMQYPTSYQPSYYNNSRPKFSEVRQFDSNNERDTTEEMAELFAIIKATELLESLYSRDNINSSEYSEACVKLINQFRTTEAALRISGAITNGEAFFREFSINCPRALERLVKSGVPATIVQGSYDARPDVKIVAETVQAFITAMDAIRLGQRATDEIQPLIVELSTSLNKVPGLSPDFEGILKAKYWLQKLNNMRASDEISEDDSRQLSFDLESSYNSFHSFLSHK